MKKYIMFSLFFFLCFYFIPNGFNFGMIQSYAEAPSIIKFATLAPEGSTWTNVLRDVDKELQEKSVGKIRLKIYAGGVSGDEKDVVRKMRINQIHCAAFTGVGLGEILSDVRIFDLPFFLREYKEIDNIRDKFTARFAEKFDEKGYIFLGWTEVGFVHFYSTVNIKTMNDLRSAKMWMWEGDPLAQALFDAIQLSPIPLSITDVVTSLQTGLVQSIYVSPLGIIALQWYPKVKYMLDIPMSNATGAILLNKNEFNKIPPELQELLKETFKVHTKRLIDIIRKDNEDSIGVLKDSGISIISMDSASNKQLEDAGLIVRKTLTGKLYSEEFLNDMTAEIEKFRDGDNK